MRSDAMGVDGARDVGCGCSRPSAGARSATFPLYASPDRARLDSPRPSRLSLYRAMRQLIGLDGRRHAVGQVRDGVPGAGRRPGQRGGAEARGRRAGA